MLLTLDEAFTTAFARHAAHTLSASKLLLEMLQQPGLREALVGEVAGLERAGNLITRDTMRALHQTWLTPRQRDEIHRLISCMEDILNSIAAAAETLALCEAVRAWPEAIEAANMLAASCSEIILAITRLQNTRDTGTLPAFCGRITCQEHDADTAFRAAVSRILPERCGPTEIMQCRDVLGTII